MNSLESPTLTISIVSHKQIFLVERLLDSLMNFQPILDINIVVLENVHDQPKIDFDKYNFQISYIKNDLPVSLAINTNKIFALFGRDSDYFCILNPDTVFTEEVFSLLISTMRAKKIDIISPLIVGSDRSIQDSFRSFPTPIELISRYFRIQTQHYDFASLPTISYPDWIGAMFMLMPASVFSELKGFDTRYKLYFEDVDFCYRARMKNYSIGVLKDVQVIHDAQRKSRRNIFYLHKHVVSAIKFFSSKEYRSLK